MSIEIEREDASQSVDSSAKGDSTRQNKQGLAGAPQFITPDVNGSVDEGSSGSDPFASNSSEPRNGGVHDSFYNPSESEDSAQQKQLDRQSAMKDESNQVVWSMQRAKFEAPIILQKVES